MITIKKRKDGWHIDITTEIQGMPGTFICTGKREFYSNKTLQQLGISLDKDPYSCSKYGATDVRIFMFLLYHAVPDRVLSI
jgi:hypothetical protein